MVVSVMGGREIRAMLRRGAYWFEKAFAEKEGRGIVQLATEMAGERHTSIDCFLYPRSEVYRRLRQR